MGSAFTEGGTVMAVCRHRPRGFPGCAETAKGLSLPPGHLFDLSRDTNHCSNTLLQKPALQHEQSFYATPLRPKLPALLKGANSYASDFDVIPGRDHGYE
jgi:hypothetical protein